MNYVSIFIALVLGQGLFFSLALYLVRAWRQRQGKSPLTRYRTSQGLLIISCGLLVAALVVQALFPWDRPSLDFAVLIGLIAMVLLSLVSCAISHRRLQRHVNAETGLAEYRAVLARILSILIPNQSKTPQSE